ncbi:MAG TPA: hypothetical protein VMB72_05790, partial [Acidimicrobiales bacterium]|nr:hypothetical protein [Acidimicrobiales bacterium]
MALALGVLGGLCAVASSAGSPAGATGAGCGTGQTLSATPDTALDNLFQNYGNAGQGTTWTGGDGTESVSAGPGFELWLFNDSVLGLVTDGQRDFKKSGYIHNSVVAEVDGVLTRTFYTHRTTRATAYLNPRPAHPYVYAFWPGASVVNGATLQVLGSLQRFNKAGTPTQIGEELATFRLPDLKRLSLQAMPASSVNWSGGVPLREGGDTYLYGNSSRGIEVARVAGTDLDAPWAYYDGSGWSAQASAAVPIESVQATGYFSISDVGGSYVLIAKTSVGSDEIEGAVGCSPTGPFGPLQNVYATPEESEYPASDGVVTYGAHAHPELAAPADSVVVSYDVNPRGPEELNVPDASIYRPRF